MEACFDTVRVGVAACGCAFGAAEGGHNTEVAKGSVEAPGGTKSFGFRGIDAGWPIGVTRPGATL